MIKGCNKRVIVMKDTGHHMIEEAFFILKPASAGGKSSSLNENDIIKQANLILDAGGYSYPFDGIKLNVNSPQKKRSRAISFLLGTGFGIVVTYIVSLLL